MRKFATLFAVIFLMAVLLFALPACARAQSAYTPPTLDIKFQASEPPPQFSYMELYNFKENSAVHVILAPTQAHWDVNSLVANLPNFPRVHFVFDIAPILGVTGVGAATAGLTATHLFVPFKHYPAYGIRAGGYGRVESHKPLIAGLVIGLEIK